MYYDEDGDLAHEFYEETVVTRNGRKRAKLRRIQKNLIPQVIWYLIKTEEHIFYSDVPFWWHSGLVVNTVAAEQDILGLMQFLTLVSCHFLAFNIKFERKSSFAV